MNLSLVRLMESSNVLVGRFYYFNSPFSFPAIRQLVFRVVNPFLFYLYTKETIVLTLGGLVGSFVQARIMSVAMPFAILSMDYSRMSQRVYWGCVLWTVLAIAYQFYALWFRHLIGVSETNINNLPFLFAGGT